ncbi:hypothetical protein J7F03_35800 [Streptomyces sp. ISL-43]|uniref:HoxN/HupN/NixA family nickel/cobalt transporter n=1 Tax=Streptomyces sp. ISL-43 TaxID=2819183 RepID=UPI001BECA1CF|nr:hypothetical protein [Streptomyces sp. ISL-43]MBT2452333.1 hypothetical protein [Streptomyces sp. ISL-43]
MHIHSWRVLARLSCHQRGRHRVRRAGRNRFQACFAEIGGVIGTLVSGVFLYVAFVVGTVELVSLLADQADASDRRPWSYLTGLDLNTIGIVVVVTFLATWIGAVAVWKIRRYDDRYPTAVSEDAGSPATF